MFTQMHPMQKQLSLNRGASTSKFLSVALVVTVFCIAMDRGRGAEGPHPTVPPVAAEPAAIVVELRAALFDTPAAGHPDEIKGAGESSHLLRGEGGRRATAALDRFLATPAAVMTMSLPDRVELQQRLWKLFDTQADVEFEIAFPKSGFLGARAGLRRKLAAAIRAVALTPEQIKSLPDNYAEAVRSGAFAAEVKEAGEERPLLPADLFDEKGPWVCVSVGNGLMAPMHTHADAGRSMFDVFLRLPAGRQAGLDYVQKLAKFRPKWIKNPEPMTREMVNEQGVPVPIDGKWVPVPTRFEMLLNPEAPQLPEGTAVAVVGRALAIDTAGDLEATRCTNLVRFRVMKDIPAATAHILNPDNFRDSQDIEKHLGRQDYYEFTRDPEGRLRATRDVARTVGCAGCHQGQVAGFSTGPGVFSVLSFTRAFFSDGRENALDVFAATYGEDMGSWWKTRRAEWGMLRTYWELAGK